MKNRRHNPQHSPKGTALRKLIPTAIIAVAVAVLAAAGTVAAQSTQRFGDVPPDAYYYEAVNWAVDHGITTGCGDGTNFCPTRTLTRAETVTFLHRYHNKVLTAGTILPKPEVAPGLSLDLSSDAGFGPDFEVGPGVYAVSGLARVAEVVHLASGTREGWVGDDGVVSDLWIVGCKRYDDPPGRYTSHGTPYGVFSTWTLVLLKRSTCPDSGN